MKNTIKTILLLVIILVPLILLLTNIDTVQRYVRENLVQQNDGNKDSGKTYRSIFNISRETESFGDYKYKKNKDRYINPIICIPDIYTFNLNAFLNNDTWILLSSDGLFVYLDHIFITKVINILLSLLCCFG